MKSVHAINCELSGAIIKLVFWDGNYLESVNENIKLWRILQVNLTHQYFHRVLLILMHTVELLGADDATG